MTGSVSMKVSGPLFDGRTISELRSLGNDIQETLITESERTLRGFAARSFKTHPTFKWEAELAVVKFERDMVLRNPVIYNNWLEGEGSRNFPKTRFRGYRIWRRTFQALEARAPVVIREKLLRHAERGGWEVR
jgi:hypothetical protein